MSSAYATYGGMQYLSAGGVLELVQSPPRQGGVEVCSQLQSFGHSTTVTQAICFGWQLFVSLATGVQPSPGTGPGSPELAPALPELAPALPSGGTGVGVPAPELPLDEPPLHTAVTSASQVKPSPQYASGLHGSKASGAHCVF